MPELPEVETVRRQLSPLVTGSTILSLSRVHAPASPKYHAFERAQGARIERVERRGKFLSMPLSNGFELIVHLGMSGALLTEEPADHVRVCAHLEGAAIPALWFRDPRRFGRVLVLAPNELSLSPTLAKLGPEPLSEAFTLARFELELAKMRGPIKAALLSQRPVAGLGNMYVDEALWRSRIHPEHSAHTIPKAALRRLHAATRAVLEEALADGGTSFRDYQGVNGERGGHYTKLEVYGRDGQPCLQCETILEKQVIAQRGTTFCPRCQRLPRGAG